MGVGQMLRDHVARWKEDPETYTGMPSEKVVMVHNLMRKGELVPQVRVSTVGGRRHKRKKSENSPKFESK